MREVRNVSRSVKGSESTHVGLVKVRVDDVGGQVGRVDGGNASPPLRPVSARAPLLQAWLVRPKLLLQQIPAQA